LTKDVFSKALRSSNKAIGAIRGEKSSQLEMERQSQLLAKSLRNPKRSAANIYAAPSDIIGECDADALVDYTVGGNIAFRAKASLTNTASFQTSNLSEGKSSICNNFAEARDTLGPLSTDP